MWRGAKAWARIIQVKEQHEIAPFVANIIPFHNSEWLRGIWTSTSALQCKHIIHHFLDFNLGRYIIFLIKVFFFPLP